MDSGCDYIGLLIKGENMKKNYYELLGVEKYFKPHELNDALTSKLREVVEDEPKALELCEAFVVLSNPEEKAKYDADDDYVYNPNNMKLKKPDRILATAKSQVYSLRFSHNNRKKKGLSQFFGGIFCFVVLGSCTVIPIIFHLGFWVVLFPSLAISALGAGVKGIIDYFNEKKLDKRYSSDDVWDYVDLIN